MRFAGLVVTALIFSCLRNGRATAAAAASLCSPFSCEEEGAAADIDPRVEETCVLLQQKVAWLPKGAGAAAREAAAASPAPLSRAPAMREDERPSGGGGFAEAMPLALLATGGPAGTPLLVPAASPTAADSAMQTVFASSEATATQAVLLELWRKALLKSHSWHNVAVVLKALFVAFIIVTGMSFAISEFLRRHLEKIDRDLIGADIHIRRLWFNPFKLTVTGHDVTIDNMAGYTSKYLMRADHVFLDFDAIAFLSSGMKRITIDSLLIDRLTVHYEKKMNTSNVEDMVHFIYYGEPGSEPLPPSGREYCVHQTAIRNITVSADGTSCGRFHSNSFPLKDLVYEDLNSESGKALLGDLLRSVVLSLLRKVIDAGFRNRVSRATSCVTSIGTVCSPKKPATPRI
eukprot:TRINITY_DN71484_c0_g1_i1.p1 TRINITY_DN71484_c0_g1~~TRINITY_DN71484_c0_g1_i1.p1  ORF type:complete len:403 (-),score=68.02 TRINITY_DN71484_c0_g1_i1:163-1371(-)